MPAELVTLIFIIAAVALVGALVFLLLPGMLGPIRCGHARPWPPYTVAEAHQEMQALIRCDADSCPAKGAALEVLRVAGHLTPARADR